VHAGVIIPQVFYEHIELPAKLLDYFLRSNKHNINQKTTPNSSETRWRSQQPMNPLGGAHHQQIKKSVADLIHESRVQFPNATVIHNGGVR